MRYQWSKLNRQQLGAYTEYFVKMEFTMFGFQVYGSEVDDRGIDFVVRHEDSRFFRVQVKSVCKGSYVFLSKDTFKPSQPDMLLALGIMKEGLPPVLYLIPSSAWLDVNAVFRDRPYEGLKSAPEWGLNISKRNQHILDQYLFEVTLARITET